MSLAAPKDFDPLHDQVPGKRVMEAATWNRLPELVYAVSQVGRKDFDLLHQASAKNRLGARNLLPARAYARRLVQVSARNLRRAAASELLPVRAAPTL